MALDLKGRQLGRLKVIERARIEGAHNAMWLCRCSCGNTTIVAAANLGRTTFSCGCLAKETAANLLRERKYSKTHGKTGSAEYRVWQLMKRRCYNKNDEKYPIYGGRGIVVCDRWRNSFPNFLTDMGNRPSPKHSIERRNMNGNYEPNNCELATAVTQMRNTSRNVFVVINGQRRCVAEWCDIFGVYRSKPYEMTYRRGRNHNLPPAFSSIEDAIRELYRQHRR